MRDAYVGFDGCNEHSRIDLISEEPGQASTGIALDCRTTSGGHTWSDDDWLKRVDLHLRWADDIAVILGTGVRYNQLWCELRAKKIGAHHPDPRPRNAS